ncbi:hypothetical protein [Spirillospora sp. NPDC047279]|uniref:hypothetical protein n=1 Tax=Spirillospora sp. NPDC047279 TaxID=3155478 RepID=UPI0033C015FD
MSNGARHGLGVVAGVVAIPVVGAGLLFGFQKLDEQRARYIRFDADFSTTGLVAVLIVGATAAVIAVLAGSRLSPFASLIPGLVFTAYGLIWLLKPLWLSDKVPDLPRRLELANLTMSVYGVPFLVGMILLGSSVLPSRWSSRRAKPALAPAGPGVLPHGAGLPAAPTPMYGRPEPWSGPPAAPTPYGQPPPPNAPGMPQSPPPAPAQAPQAPPQAAPQAPPQAPAPPPAHPSAGSRPSDDDDDAPGEWTRMYGGDDLNKGGGSR